MTAVKFTVIYNLSVYRIILGVWSHVTTEFGYCWEELFLLQSRERIISKEGNLGLPVTDKVRLYTIKRGNRFQPFDGGTTPTR